MLRRVPRIALCLIAGAILTIATAWSFAIFTSRPANALNATPTAWPVPVPANWTPPESDYTGRGFGISLHFTTARSEVPFRPWPGYIRKLYTAEVITTGWPCRALYCKDTYGARERLFDLVMSMRGFSNPPETRSDPEQIVPLSLTEAWPVPDWIDSRLNRGVAAWSTETNRMPNHILPRGFILNTLFYATSVYALFSLALFLRSTYRRRRHHCPACNYSLAGLPPHSPCPECGRARPAP